jgi:phage shock protein PspC (stress-responsive transcriptional regulator)
MNYPESGPRRLRRSRNDRWIGGVCGGIAEYLNMDPTLVRVAVVIIALVTAAVPVIAIYLLMMLLIPEAEYRAPGSIGPAPRFGWQQQNPQQHSDPVWGPAGPPWRPSRDPNIDTSAPQPPRQSAEDLFSRAKHPTRPSTPTGDQPAGGPTAGPATGSSAEPDVSEDDKPGS